MRPDVATVAPSTTMHGRSGHCCTVRQIGCKSRSLRATRMLMCSLSISHQVAMAVLLVTTLDDRNLSCEMHLTRRCASSPLQALVAGAPSR